MVLNEIMAQVLQIFVRTLSGKTLPLEVEGYNTVASAKRGKVEEEARHPRHRQHLVCDETELPDDKALLLEHCHERNRSMLHHYLCLREAMQVLVRSPYCKTMYVEEWVGDIIIRAKRRMQQKVRVPRDQQCLTFASSKQVTDDCKALRCYNTQRQVSLGLVGPLMTINIKMLTGETHSGG